jgi:diaminopimelate decarboxylase
VKATGPIPADFVADANGQLLLGREPGFVQHAVDLAREGTPVFAYDWSIAKARIDRFRAAMPDEVALHYAVKANPFVPILQEMAGAVDGLDLASGGELERVLGAGLGHLPLSFAGPGKSDPELLVGLKNQVTFQVESESELERLLGLGSRAEEVAEGGSLRGQGALSAPRLAVRINPPFGLKGSGMKMGGLASPFGVDHDKVPGLIQRIVEAGAEWRGLHVYAGSQSLSAGAIAEMQRATMKLAGEIAESVGTAPPEVNLGGGFGIPYFAGDQPLNVEALGAALGQTLAERPAILRDTKFVIELGRWLVGECGVYLTRVVDRKVSRGKTFLVVDGGLHHMLAASGNFGQLLRRNYPVAVAHRFGAEADEVVSVVGCLCTPLDLLADEVALPRAEVGDVIAIFCAGAYGLTASPQAFLSQGAAREVLVSSSAGLRWG